MENKKTGKEQNGFLAMVFTVNSFLTNIDQHAAEDNRDIFRHNFESLKPNKILIN